MGALLSYETSKLLTTATRRSDEIKRGKARDLFLYIAKSVEHFMTKRSQAKTDEELLLGFTFSFVSPRRL